MKTSTVDGHRKEQLQSLMSNMTIYNAIIKVQKVPVELDFHFDT